MIEAREHLIGGWVFPPECKWASEEDDSVERLKYYLDLLKKKVNLYTVYVAYMYVYIHVKSKVHPFLNLYGFMYRA